MTSTSAEILSPRLERRKSLTRLLQFSLDMGVMATAFWLSYQLRFDFAAPRTEVQNALIQLPYVVLLQTVSLIVTGVYSFIWRYIGMAELKAFLYASLLAFVAIAGMRLGLPRELYHWRVPLSVVLVDCILAFGGVLGLRVLRRAVYERAQKRSLSPASSKITARRILLIGAGRAGMIAAREIQTNRDMDLRIEGFVDDDPNKIGSTISGIKCLGSTGDLPRLVREFQIDHVVISMAQASRADFRRILDICESIPVKVRVIPGLQEILSGSVKITRIRDLQIEDLLGREPVQLDMDSIQRFLTGKTIMVTGAGGSIGSELARQAASFAPFALLLVERAEFALFEIDRELRNRFPELTIVPLVADLNDHPRIRSILTTHRPQIVLHSAAHKHVPMMEMECNAIEAVKNNVFATHSLALLAGELGVEVFVLMSTDKAVRPTSIMGATKRMAELVIQDLNRRLPTRYVAVRFGNVIGSKGSVIPIFREQIQNGGPVTVTHPDMKRYFMTIPEASQLVLQAGAMGEGGEIFILDMGDQVKILDLAKAAITMSGLKPFEEIDIVFTGTRPGEKLYEELEITEEQMSKTRHPKIFIGRIAEYPEEVMVWALRKCQAIVSHQDEADLRTFISQLLPEARLSQTPDDVFEGRESSSVGAISLGVAR